jgi:hypothetical protein
VPSKATRFALLVCVLGFGGCNGGGFMGQQNAKVAGAWQAVGSSTTISGTTIEIEMDLSETNGVVSSTALLGFGSCAGALPSDAAMTGTVSGSNVSLTVSHLDVTLTLTGTVSGQAITGKYKTTGCGDDTGSWTALQMPLINGNYSGTTNPSTGQPIPLTATISANSNYEITGLLSSPISSACFSGMTLSGTQIGAIVQMAAKDGQGDLIAFTLFSNDGSFGSMTGSYGVPTGYCLGDAGTATLTKQ